MSEAEVVEKVGDLKLEESKVSSSTTSQVIKVTDNLVIALILITRVPGKGNTSVNCVYLPQCI